MKSGGGALLLSGCSLFRQFMETMDIKIVLDVQREFREDFEGLLGPWNGTGFS
jgi:hypothetical protein